MPDAKDPDMREALETARMLITARAEAVATRDYVFMDRQVAELVIGRDRDALIVLVQALVNVGSLLAAFPSQVIDELGRDSVPAGLVERYGDPHATLRFAWLLVEQSQANE